MSGFYSSFKVNSFPSPEMTSLEILVEADELKQKLWPRALFEMLAFITSEYPDEVSCISETVLLPLDCVLETPGEFGKTIVPWTSLGEIRLPPV